MIAFKRPKIARALFKIRHKERKGWFFGKTTIKVPT
jgi:hypothetical protein